MPIDLERGLAPTRRVLPNGGVVLAKESGASPAVTMSAAVAAGTIVDPAEAPGTAHFLSRVIDRGTARRTPEEMGEWLDERGVSLNVGVNRHQMVVSCTCLSEDFGAMLELLAEVLQTPALPEREIETHRVEIVTAIRQDQDNPAVTAVEEVLEMLFPGGHPYGRRVKGSIDVVERIDRARLAACHERHVTPASLTLACVGDVEAPRVVDEAARVFGAWQGTGAAPAVPPQPPPVEGRRQSVVEVKGKAQADIAYGFAAIARHDPSYYAFSILNNVLGQYALGGRLGDSIRERQGMAYYVFSALEANLAVGPLLVRAGVNPSNVERTVASIDEELRKVGSPGTELEFAL